MAFFFFNGGPVYHVSLAVIYTAMRRTGGSLYWPEADFKQSPMERETGRERKRESKKKDGIKEKRGKNNCTK